MAADTTGLPAPLAEVVTDFHEVPESDRLTLLLEFSTELAPLPPEYADHPELLEPVPECQSPIAFVTEIVRAREDGTAPDDDADEPAARVHFYASAPAGAPTSRGFAGILAEGLDGLTPQEVIAVPGDYPLTLGLAEAVSPLRLRGMTALLARAKRQVSERMAG